MNRYKQLAEIMNNFPVISLDVFDTLLLRKTTPELLRFYRLSKLLSKKLKKKGIQLSAKELFFSRLLATKLAYSTTGLTNGDREPKISTIIHYMIDFLGLENEIGRFFLKLELDFEKRQLKRNNRLYKLLNDILEKKDIIIISDMYLSKENITDIINYKFKSDFYNKIYVSSEYNLTKHKGNLYNLVRWELKLSPGEALHIGDSYQSDFHNANRLGMSGFWLPRSKLWRGIRAIREKIVSTRYRKQFQMSP